MAGYYVYVIGDDGHVQSRVDIFCKDDDEAKGCAKQMVDGHAIELWQQARRVAAFEPEK